MKKRPPAPKDPQVVEHELLQKTEELRHLKQRMNDLQDEHRKNKANQVRLEKMVAKRDDGGASDAVGSGAAGAGAGAPLKPRDAQQVAALLDDQRRRMEEKDKLIKSLLAGSRMQDIGGKRAGATSGSNPAAIYGAAKRPQKRAVASRPASATRRPLASSQASRADLHSSRADLSHADHDDMQQPDFQPAMSRAASTANVHQQTPMRSAAPSVVGSPRAQAPAPAPVAAASADSGADDHYTQFNARLQSRLNSSQNFHRNALGVGDAGSGGGGGGGGGDGSGGGNGPSDGDAPGHLDDVPGGGGSGGDLNELVWIRRELRQKKAKIASLQNHFDHLTVSFRVEKDLQKITLAQCEELKASLAASQARERNFQRQLQSLDDSRLQLEHQQSVITDLQGDKRALEERIAQLHTNLFSGDTAESLRHKQLLSEHAQALSRVAAELEEKDRALRALKQTNSGLLEKSLLGDSLARDKERLSKENKDLREKCAELMEKLVVFSVDSGVEVEELERALDIVRRQKDDPARVDFLHSGSGSGAGSDPAQDTVPSLRRRLGELELQCRDYIVEIQQKSDMLNVQHALNREQKKRAAEDKRKVAALQAEVDRLKFELSHRPTAAAAAAAAGGGGVGGDNLSESIFAMSDAGSTGDGANIAAEQLTGLENLIAFRVLSATLRADSPHWSGPSQGPGTGAGGASTSPRTFLGADFYEFESSFSEVVGGLRPEYRFTTQYLVDADQFLVQHLESEELVLTLYEQLGGTEYRKVACAFVPLRGLLAPTGAVEGKALLVRVDSNGAAAGSGVRGSLRDGDASDAQGRRLGGAHDDADVVGEVHYVMRMKRPILSTPPSPAGSRGATPLAGRSRQGSISGPSSGGYAAISSQTLLQHQQQQQRGGGYHTQQQPSVVSGTLSLHHANRDVQPAVPSWRGAATTNQQPSSASPALRPLQPQQLQSQAQTQSQFGRQQSTSSGRPPLNTQAQSGQSLTMDDFDSARQQQQQQRQTNAYSQAQPQQQYGRDPRPSNSRIPSSGRDAGAGGSRGWDDETEDPFVAAAASAAAPAPSAQRQSSITVGGRGGVGGAGMPASSTSSRRSSARRADDEEHAIRSLLDNPDSQADLFGNADSDRRHRQTRDDEDTF